MYLYYKREDGFVLIVAMVILLLLSVMGVAVMRATNTDLQIAGNERRAKHAFYKADGGTEAGIEMLEENLACAGGFNSPNNFKNDDPKKFFSLGGIDVFDAKFAGDLVVGDIPGSPASKNDIPSDSYRTLRISDDLAASPRSDVAPHINLAIYGTTGLATGSATQMSVGYHGPGSGDANGGAIKRMDIYSRYDGLGGASARILLEYAHLIGSEGACNY